MTSPATGFLALRASFFDLSEDLLAVAGLDGYFKALNPNWAVLGFTEDDLLSRPWIDRVHPDDRDVAAAALAALAAGEPLVSFAARCLTVAGSCRWLSWTGRPAVGTDLVLFTVHDSTADMNRQRLDHARVAMTTAIAASGGWTDAVDGVLEALHVEWGWPDTKRSLSAVAETTRHQPTAPAHVTIEQLALLDDICRDLSDFSIRLLCDRERRDNLDADLVAVDVRGVRETTTGLPSEALMVDRIDMAIHAAWRAKTELAVMTIGFNGFTSVSLDQPHGRDVAIAVAKEVAARLEEASDGWGSLGRLSGSKYVFVSSGSMDAAAARRLATHLCAAFEHPLVCAGGATVGVSVGVAMYPENAEDRLNLLRCAEAALQSARSLASGWSCYEPAMVFDGVLPV